MPFSKSGGNKKKSGFGVVWIPSRSHKHKKNKYYIRDNYASPKRAMMSGDTPNSHAKDYFDFKEGRSTPPPTTSKDIAVQSCSSGDAKADILTAAVILEPIKEPYNNYIEITDSKSNHSNEDEIITQEEKPFKNAHLADEENNERLNGIIDKLDGNWVPSSDLKKEEYDDTCTVRCLYYTLQCCECSIM
ncbi:hypothetical protein FQA39_LY14089 [Lamprigera yunnana]|nr:hypothetical protein FQA39_LY14089 [Lamprigera yunnana]